MALLPPSFLSSSPATVRSARTGAVKEASAGLVRPAAKRGHGPARLDGTRARATVAVKVMKSGETAGQGNGHPTRRPHGKRSAQARSWKPGRRRQPSGARERWKPEGARRCRRLDAQRARQRDRPCFLAGDAQHSMLDAQAHAPVTGKQVRQRLLRPGRSGAAGSAVFEGRQASRGGDSPQGFPLEASEARSAAGAKA